MELINKHTLENVYKKSLHEGQIKKKLPYSLGAGLFSPLLIDLLFTYQKKRTNKII